MKRKLVSILLLSAVLLSACNSRNANSRQANSGNRDNGDSEAEEEESEAEAPKAAYERTDDYIIFGTYEQDGNLENGPEPIEWQIVHEGDGKIFLMSRYILDVQPYNTEAINVTWETSSLRNWLNNDFYNTAFSDSDKNQIITASISTPDNPYYGTEGGNDTEDKVFCMSIEETQQYYEFSFWRDDYYDGGCIELVAEATPYALQGYLQSYKGCGYWWLRSPGQPASDLVEANCFRAVGYTDSTNEVNLGVGGCDVNSNHIGVRPSIYIKQ